MVASLDRFADRRWQLGGTGGLAVVLGFTLSLAGLVVWQLHGVALAASHLAGAYAEARDHSGCERNGGGRHPLANQSRGFGMAGASECAVGVDGGAHWLGFAGALGTAAGFAGF